MKKFSRIGIILIFSLYIAGCAGTLVYATDDYTVLAPLPGTTVCDQSGGSNCTTELPTYLRGLFNFSIGLAAVLAFVMITFGGITYATADAVFQKENGRVFITNAIYGLLIVIGAYAILYTINPKILDFNLTIEKPAVPTRESLTVGQTMTPEEILADSQVRAQLKSNNININHDSPCATGATQGCTNLNGLPSNAINGLIDLKKSCNCNVVVSGGTEGGHLTHGVGDPVVDLQPVSSLNLFLGVTQPTGSPHATVVTKGNATYTYENTGDNGRATAPHWHVTFK